MYWAAEELHSSGVLAVVCGGLYLSNRRLHFLSSTSRVRGYSVWESFVFILNGIVFLLIGLDLPEVVVGLRAEGIPMGTAIGYGVLVASVLIGTRIISAYAAMVATLLFRPGVAPRTSPRTRWMIPLVLGWTGMRGVVSLAAALAIPVSLSDGTDFPHRNLILFITFVAILITLLVQGLTLPGLIRRASMYSAANDEDDAEVRRKLKQGLHDTRVDYVKRSLADLPAEHPMQQWAAMMDSKSKLNYDPKDPQLRHRMFEMLECQRAFLLESNRDHTIDEDFIRHELYLIDLEEERLKLLH